MKVILDTNIVLDVILKREPHVSDSLTILKLTEANHITAYLAANTIADVFYILRKHTSDKAVLIDAIVNLLHIVDVCDILKSDVIKALGLQFDDYEDALISCCAKRMNLDFIITRDKKGFSYSAVKAISPEEFIKRYFRDTVL